MIGKEVDGNLEITLELEEPFLSKSGKTHVVASSRGVRKTGVKIDGKPVYYVATAFTFVKGKDSAQPRETTGDAELRDEPRIRPRRKI